MWWLREMEAAAADGDALFGRGEPADPTLGSTNAGFDPRTIANWEQGRPPDRAARALLRAIAHQPEEAARAQEEPVTGILPLALAWIDTWNTS
jgi:hypothetical protein